MVEKVLFGLLIGGIVALTLPEMEDIYRIIRVRFRKWILGFKNSEEWLEAREERLEERILEHLRRLLQVTFGLGTRRSVVGLLFLSWFMSAATLVLVGAGAGTGMALISAAFVFVLPYLVLESRLKSLRVVSSHEGELLITELLNNYKINYYNMQQAIEETAKTLEEAPNSRRLLFNLAKGLNTTADSEGVTILLDEFRYSINTSWANILATNIHLAHSSGMRVTESLRDLAETIKNARKVEEYARRENNEATLILKYLIPVCGILTVIGGIIFFDLSIEEFIMYQFFTPAGVTWFAISVIIYISGVLINIMLSRRKLDL